MNKSAGNSYQDYAKAMKALTSAQQTGEVPRFIVLHGASDFLRMKSMAALKLLWSRLEGSEPQQIEAGSLDSAGFRSLWSQVSLFEPDTVYILRRCDKHAKMATWLKEVPAEKAVKTHLVFELGEKIPAELSRQFSRLKALLISCVEPTSLVEYGRIAAQLGKREGIVLADDAVRLLLDAMGQDLSKINNEVQKIGLVFHDRKEPLRASDIAPIVGALREDHVFELFHLLRNGQKAKAQILIDQLLQRGEKAIALTGILSRYAREILPRKPDSALRGLKLCAEADILLKSSRGGEGPVLGQIVNELIAASTR